MKNKKAFTLVELLIVIAIIGLLAAILLPAIAKAKNKSVINQRTHTPSYNSSTPDNKFNLGDSVYIDGLDTTGKVNSAYGNGYYDLLVKGTNGGLSTIERVNEGLLHKVQTW